jgi:hypothetical protein
VNAFTAVEARSFVETLRARCARLHRSAVSMPLRMNIRYVELSLC